MKMCYLFYGCFFFLAFPVWSQTWEEKGHRQFRDLAYSDAIISLEKALDKGKGNYEIYSHLADANYFIANYQASAKWFKIMFKSSESQSAIHFLRYAQTLKSMGKYDEAEVVLKKMAVSFPKESARITALLLGDKENKYLKQTDRFQVQLALFNSAESDFGPSYFGNQIVFASTRDTGSVFKREHSWTNQSFTDLYLVSSDSANLKPTRFSKQINSKFNESTAVFTKDGLTMYFTRNNYLNKKQGIDEKQTTLLKIYKAENTAEKWKITGVLPFCSDAFNTAHPALSPDEQTLFFASDMPGGFGQSDLYRVAINPDGTFGAPENLGASINTLGRETFPFVSQKEELYFASDAHNGYGGLDIFIATTYGNQIFANPQNVGKSVNSSMDDFGFIINSENATGYFTSNRSGGAGGDDIYTFQETISLISEAILEGTVAVEDGEIPLDGIEVILLDANSNQVDSTTTDKDGNYFFKIDPKNNYKVQTALKGYNLQIISVESNKNGPTILNKITLEKEEMQFQIGDDLAEKLALLPIYFDLNKSDIRPDAAKELLKIKEILIANPNMTIEVRSHTDSRNSFEYNQKLSDRRAVATLNWLTENGIEGKRLSGVGFGESRLVNFCADEVPCSEAEHQLNRRSEFIVTQL